MSRVIVLDCPQRSDEWRAARAGRLTGSSADAMLASIKTGEAAVRRDLRYRIVAERLTGIPAENGYTSADMQWGTDHEADALAAYETLTGNIVMPVGFVALTDILAGCSPDGLIGADGILSIKCPKTATHVRYLHENRVPPDYLPQILCELWVTDRQWVDFMSYDPRLPENIQTFLIRYERDEDAIDAFAAKAHTFLAECEAEEHRLRQFGRLKETA